MDNLGGKKRADHFCGVFCPCGKMSWGHFLIKIFLALVAVALVLVIAMAVVVKVGHGVRDANGRWGMTCGQVSTQARFGGEKAGGMVMMGGGNVAFQTGKEEAAMAQRIFGNIIKIEANQITITNNAAQAQVVMSQADTVIISSSTEVGLSALKAGQDIIVFGSLDKDNKLVAKLIQIQ